MRLLAIRSTAGAGTGDRCQGMTTIFVPVTYVPFAELTPVAKNRALEWMLGEHGDMDFGEARIIALEAFGECLPPYFREAVENHLAWRGRSNPMRLQPFLDLSFCQGSGFSVQGQIGPWMLTPNHLAGHHEMTVNISTRSGYAAPGRIDGLFREAMQVGYRAACNFWLARDYTDWAALLEWLPDGSEPYDMTPLNEM